MSKLGHLQQVNKQGRFILLGQSYRSWTLIYTAQLYAATCLTAAKWYGTKLLSFYFALQDLIRFKSDCLNHILDQPGFRLLRTGFGIQISTRQRKINLTIQLSDCNHHGCCKEMAVSERNRRKRGYLDISMAKLQQWIKASVVQCLVMIQCQGS